jgi:hypothetical protein
MSHALGEAVLPKKPPTPPRHVLENSLVAIRERMSEINFLLGEGPGEHRAQELKSEYELYRDQVREIERTLNPPAEDAELAALQAASISQQIEQAKRDHAPAPADIVEERKRNAAQRREALLELQFAEQSEVLRHQILRWDQQGEYAQSKRLRVQLTNLRADLEKQFPA